MRIQAGPFQCKNTLKTEASFWHRDKPVSSQPFRISSKGLVTNFREGGGYKTGRGGHVKFLPPEKGGETCFSHAEGGGGAHKVLGLFLRSSLKF